jgi:hypothetical protein
MGAVLPTFGDVVASIKDYPRWEYDVIQGLGGKPNPVNLLVMNLIAGAEGMPGDANNWMAITGGLGTPGGDAGGKAVAPGEWNTFGAGGDEHVAVYPNLAKGVQGTIDFFNLPNHAKLKAALINPSTTLGQLVQAFITDGAWAGDDATLLKNYYATTTLGVTPPIYKAGVTTGPASGEAGTGSGTFKQCNSRNVLIGEGGVLGVGKLNLLNACQAKAIVGGLLVGLGGAIFLGGLALIVTKGVESAGVGAILGRGGGDITAPVKGAAKATTAAPATATAPVRPPRPAPTPLAPGQHVTNYQGRPHLETWTDSQGRKRSKAIF